MSEINFERGSGIPEGLHYFRLSSVEEKSGPKGTYFEFTCTVEERSDCAGETLPLRLSLSANARWKVDEFLDAVQAPEAGKGTFQQFVGQMVRGKVEHSEYDGRPKSEIVNVLPMDVAAPPAPPVAATVPGVPGVPGAGTPTTTTAKAEEAAPAPDLLAPAPAPPESDAPF